MPSKRIEIQISNWKKTYEAETRPTTFEQTPVEPKKKTDFVKKN